MKKKEPLPFSFVNVSFCNLRKRQDSFKDTACLVYFLIQFLCQCITVVNKLSVVWNISTVSLLVHVEHRIL